MRAAPSKATARSYLKRDVTTENVRALPPSQRLLRAVVAPLFLQPTRGNGGRQAPEIGIIPFWPLVWAVDFS